MKRILFIILTFSILASNTARADEGMWLLSLIGKNYEQMKKQGFKLTSEDIYRVNSSSLKDAVIGLSNEGSPFWHFCTGELISGEGLFSTNHHCGFGMIQSHSSVENDYLRDGFWAKKKSEELPNEGITAQILDRMEDVSSQVLVHLNDEMTEVKRAEIIDSISKIIVEKSTKGTILDGQVIDVFHGNQYFLFLYTTYKDVRMVGAPPQSMGKFGGDTDNWEWPRHTADFALFRIYTDKNGKPATYATDNIPLKPKHFFPISIKGIKEKDFSMIMGFPGTTNRFVTSFGLEEVINIKNRLVHNIRSVKIEVLRKKMAESQKTRIQYASKYASCSNYWKYALQQNKALNKLKTIENKREIEKRYTSWASTQKESKYKHALGMIRDGYVDRAKSIEAQMYLNEGVLRGPEIIFFALDSYYSLLDIEKIEDAEARKKATEEFYKGVDAFYKDFDVEVERSLIDKMFDYTYKNMNPEYHPAFFTNVLGKKYKGNSKKYADYIISKSIFASKEKLEKALESKNGIKIFFKDPAVSIALSTYGKLKDIRRSNAESNLNIEKGQRYFVYGILQLNKENLLAPDANSTIRMTYGNIGGYDPRDGVEYDYYTTLDGVMQKEDPNNHEFIVPQKLKDLYNAKDFGRYADKKGNLPVCFISNNDITGGNSGSPVLDAEGNLIGLAFDGNSEAMSGDIDFEKNLQRCINLDVRYMLFIIDKFAGAKNLIEEMKIID